jgi:hypothetical protein
MSHVIDHDRALLISSGITTNLRRMYKRMAANVQPQEVIRALNQGGIKFVLIGAHGIAGWLDEPRATQDVDILVQANHRKAIQVLRKAFPDLVVEELSAVTRFCDRSDGLSVIDLIKAQAALHKAVPKNAYQVGKTHRIPDLEMSLALKYGAMQSANRTLKKRLQDKADFIGMVTKNLQTLDTEKLYRLGEMVKRGGGKAIVRLVSEAQDQGQQGLPE